MWSGGQGRTFLNAYKSLQGGSIRCFSGFHLDVVRLVCGAVEKVGRLIRQNVVTRRENGPTKDPTTN